MIETILALAPSDDGGRIMAWRQLVDIVAQSGARLGPATRADAHARIAALRADIPAAVRRSAAASFTGRIVAVEAVAIFGMDEPAVAAPVLAAAMLDDNDWLALLPSLPPASRVILRNRRDLAPVVMRALNTYGASDFALPAAARSAPAAAIEAGSQIRTLVARIEAFRSQSPGLFEGVPDDATLPIAEFAFETATDGVITWTDAPLRTAVIGMSLAEAAMPLGPGVDGQAAGAFRRRAPFRDARLAVGGAHPLGGAWLLSARPVFDPRDGRFAGYQGAARRPRADETAASAATPDALRQLVHELRTPLTAIQGFADMIDRQILGPAATAYRARAQSIAIDSRRLLDSVEDIDWHARSAIALVDDDSASSHDVGAILAQVAAPLRAVLDARGIALAIESAPALAAAVGEPALARMVRRLLTTATGLARRGETIAVRMQGDALALRLAVQRPAVLIGLDEAVLRNPAFDPDGDWPEAPLLGLGFTLRLLAKLARAVGASFVVDADAFVLIIPRMTTAPARQGEQG